MTNLEALIALHRIQFVLLGAEQNLNLLELKGDSMPGQVPPVVAEVIAKIDAATNAIAARLQSLIDKANQGALDAQAIADALQPEVAALTALGADGTPASV